MYYYVYQITNLNNGKIYVGKHKSAKHPFENGYFGSGKQITAAIKKYGVDNFKKEVLCYCDDAYEMAVKESEIVTEDFVKRSDTYNMHKGGYGGWDHHNGSDSHKEASIRGGKTRAKDPTNLFYSKEFQKKYDWTRSSEHMKAMGLLSNTPNSITKKKETFKKIKHSQGERNSQFGRYWISNIHTKEVKRISMNDTIPAGWVRGKRGHVARKLWVTNNIKEHYILTEKEQDYIIKGFSRGRLKKSMPQNRIVV